MAFSYKDIIEPNTTAIPTAPAEEPVAKPFSYMDVVTSTPSDEAKPFSYKDVATAPGEEPPKEEEKYKGKEWLFEDDPNIASSFVKDEELEKIAQAHGVAAGTLRIGADLLAARRMRGDTTPVIQDIAQSLLLKPVGMLNMLFGDFGYKAIRKLAYSEDEQKAMDEVKDLVAKRRSYLDAAMYNILPMFSGAGEAKLAVQALSAATKAEKIAVAAKTAGLSATVGAAYGFGASKTGEELEGTALGAAAGLAGTGLAYGKGKAVAALGTLAGGYMGYTRAEPGEKLEGTAIGAAFGLVAATTGYYGGGKVLRTIFRNTKDMAGGATLMEQAAQKMESRAPLESSLKKALEDSLDSETWTERVDTALGKFLLKDDERYGKLLDKALRKAEKANIPYTTQDFDRELTVKLVNKQRVELASVLEKGKAVPSDRVDAVLNNHVKRLTGREEIEKIISADRLTTVVKEVVNDTSRQLFGQPIIDKPPTILAKLIPVQKLAEVIDITHKTNVKEGVIKWYRNLNLADNARAALVKKVEPVFKEILEDEAFRGEEGGRFLARIVEEGRGFRTELLRNNSLNERQFALVDNLVNIYKDIGDELEKQGLAFLRVEAKDGTPGYIHHMLLDKSAAKIRVLGAAEKVGESILSHEGGIKALKFNAAIPEESLEKQLISSLEIMTGKEIKNNNGFIEALNRVKATDDPIITKSLGYAKATMERSGNIPDLIRNYDIRDGMHEYIYNSTRYLALREPIREIKNSIKILDKLGATEYSAYLNDFMEKNLGMQRTSLMDKLTSSWKNERIKNIVALQKQKEEMLDSILGKDRVNITTEARQAALEQTKSIDNKIAWQRTYHDVWDIGAGFVRAVTHANLLSGLKAPINDLLQPFTTGIPAIGGPYGLEVVGEAYARVVSKPMSMLGWKKEQVAKGLIKAEHLGNILALTDDRNTISKVAGLSKEAMDNYSKLLNVFRTGSSIANNQVMLESGKVLARHYFTGTGKKFADANNFINHELSVSVRARVRELNRKGALTQEKLGDILGMELAESSQFIYTKEMSSALARELGPLITQFTKYPSEVLGSLTITAARHGMMSATRQALMPVMALWAGGAMYDLSKGRKPMLPSVPFMKPEEEEEQEITPREKRLLYKGGAVSRAPLPSVVGLVPGGAPELQLYTDFLDGLSNQNAKANSKKAFNTIFNPYTGLSRFQKDFYTLITGEEPEVEEEEE